MTLSSSLVAFTGGETQLDLEVANVRQLFQELSRRYPGLAQSMESEFAVAIDGEIFEDAMLEEIRIDSEVLVFPRIGGG